MFKQSWNSYLFTNISHNFMPLYLCLWYSPCLGNSVSWTHGSLLWFMLDDWWLWKNSASWPPLPTGPAYCDQGAFHLGVVPSAPLSHAGTVVVATSKPLIETDMRPSPPHPEPSSHLGSIPLLSTLRNEDFKLLLSGLRYMSGRGWGPGS